MPGTLLVCAQAARTRRRELEGLRVAAATSVTVAPSSDSSTATDSTLTTSSERRACTGGSRACGKLEKRFHLDRYDIVCKWTPMTCRNKLCAMQTFKLGVHQCVFS